MEQGNLRGKHALITGGGTGIGKVCAGALADRGARVTIAGPDQTVLDEAAQAMVDESPNRDIQAVLCDVTVEEQVAEAVAVASLDSHLDIAVANAGTGMPGSLLHLEEAHWMQPLGVNVLGSAYTIKHAALNMKGNGGGSIVTLSSVASQRPTQFMGAYGVSKAAVEELTRTAAAELGRFNIRVNAIRPGFIQTEILMSTAGEHNVARAEQETALSRLGTEADVADALLYLVSDGAHWITGQTLGVCGGFTLVPPSMDVEHLARMIFPEQMEADFGAA